MEKSKIRVAITHGDINGIGYELIFKTFADPTILELCTPIIYGSSKAATYHRNALGIQCNFNIIKDATEANENKLNLLPVFNEDVKVEFGQQTTEGGKSAFAALAKSLDDVHQGIADVLITAPVNNKNINAIEPSFTGQAAYIEKMNGNGKQRLPILINENLRIAIATAQLPSKDVGRYITTDLIEQKTTILWNSLKRDFRISNPRIAILSLNPANAEGIANGKEETEIIIPAIKNVAEKGIQAYGPYPSETFISDGLFEAFDGVIALSDEQAMTAFSTNDRGEGIIYTAGLPIIHTAPTLTVSYEQAGKGEIDECSFRNAIYYAIDIYRNRANYDEPLRNPLKKLYHEKRDESEKVRFAIPKAKGDKTNEKDNGHKTEKE